jgi:putative membrane protein
MARSSFESIGRLFPHDSDAPSVIIASCRRFRRFGVGPGPSCKGQSMLFADFTVPENFLLAAASSITFGLIGIVLLILGYKMFDWLTPSLHFQDELKKGNIAVAIIVGVLLASIAYIAANAIR